MNYTAEKKLDYFMQTLSKTNRTPEYYVNWEKVVRETGEYELELHTLNYLIGKKNIKEEARILFLKQPNLLRAIPSLIASRDKELSVLNLTEQMDMLSFKLNFNEINLAELDEYLDFIEQTGLFDFLSNNAQRSLVDYVYGVEVGLDSNARKNRSGTTMENILERYVAHICKELGLQYVIQGTASYIKTNWNIEVPVDKSERRFDAVIYDPQKKKVWLIETNYYGGGGSKLKAVSGEFVTLNDLIKLSPDDVTFVWVTDGQGWHTAKRPLGEAFEKVNHIFNLHMLQEGYLTECVK